MPRRRHPETFDRKRGRHKKAASRETLVWEAEHLVPSCPSWLDPATYRQLVALRDRGVSS